MNEHAVSFLEKLESKIWVHRKPRKDGAHFMLSFADPGGFNQCEPLIRKLLIDNRCKSISLISDGYGSHAFAKDSISKYFQLIKSENSIHFDIARVADAVDALLLTHESAPALRSGLAEFISAKHLFYIMDSWGTRLSEGSLRNQDKIDLVFVSDNLAKKMFLENHKGIAPNKIICGIPGLDAIQVGADEVQRVRSVLELPSDSHLITFLGTPYSEHLISSEHSKEDMNIRLWKAVLEVVNEFALNNKEKHITLALRPHPRDSRGDLFYQASRDFDIEIGSEKGNLKIVNASGAICNCAALCAASSFVLGLFSTEINYVSLRGNGTHGIFLPIKGISDEAFDQVYPYQFRRILERQPFLSIADSKEDLLNILGRSLVSPSQLKLTKSEDSNTKRILETIFSRI
ncbi:MAG: hypothetical protein GYA55_07535 [SAR324 cluster bacterium]|uniref:UDP-N-acetylglucosamine 2-epimerase domain-containing protein n=1 Tax=SAR324 cluster bacterium TaxID=2024889 RepID=A0A7X9FRJ5_9DELT|nr:hypothetical protein [SAR324 cluster bacterium]